MGVEPTVADSAHKHGISDNDILHAFSSPIAVVDFDEGFTMLIGPGRDARLLEIGVVSGAEGPVIVHAMPARPKFLRSR